MGLNAGTVSFLPAECIEDFRHVDSEEMVEQLVTGSPDTLKPRCKNQSREWRKPGEATQSTRIQKQQGIKKLV